MYMLIFKIFIVFGAIVEWKAVYCSRLYDVNAEAIKLYGEDLNTVLRRFRRTPEYLAILNKKVQYFKERVQDIYSHSVNAHVEKVLANQINETLEHEHEFHEHGLRPAKNNEEAVLRSQLVLRAQESGDNTTTTTLTPAEKLEHAVEMNLNPMFTIGERNALKDLGFKVAGMVIQSLIEGIGPEEDESEKKSTKMENPTTKTKHVETTQRTTTID